MNWWDDLYDIMYAEGHIWYPVDELHLVTFREVEFLEKALELEPEAKILDLGCGSGRHSALLASRGFSVTGIDLSEKLISKARADVEGDDLPLEFICQDMRRIEYKEDFDAVIMMDVTFGIFDDDENEELIRKIYDSLKPDALLFLMVYNPYYWATHPYTTHWGSENGEIVRKYSFDPMKGRVEDAQIFINTREGVRRVHPIQSLRAYTLPELREMCRKAGFSTFVTYGDNGDFMPSVDLRFNPATSLGLYVKIRK